MRLAVVSMLIVACAARRAHPPEAAVDASPTLTRVCYGAGGAAVELPRSTPCASVGASDMPPASVPLPPRPRRTRVEGDAGALF